MIFNVIDFVHYSKIIVLYYNLLISHANTLVVNNMFFFHEIKCYNCLKYLKSTYLFKDLIVY